jgi:hypothetical protein
MDKELFTLGPERRLAVPGCPGFFMRFNRDVRKCVVFLGYPEYGPAGTNIRFQGTGFLLIYKQHGYLITARHVADLLGDTCATRINKQDGTSINLIGEVPLPWVFHPDPAVDLAFMEFEPKHDFGLDVQWITDGTILTEEKTKGNHYIEIGDLCYTVGLFRVLTGNQRNLPIIHTGRLARMAGEELIPIKAQTSPGGKQLVDGYLIETQSLSGLSGSPVFIRRSHGFAMRAKLVETAPSKEDFMKFPPVPTETDEVDVVNMVAYSSEVFLLGVFQAAWEAPAGDVIAIDRGAQITVPVGIGVVVPAAKIIEMLELPNIKARREELDKQSAENTAATPQAIEARSSFSVSNEPNPRHREDFTSLLNAAAKTKLRGN